MGVGYVLLTWLSAAAVAALPPYLLGRLWTRHYTRPGTWGADLATTLAVLALLFVAGRWDVVGLPLRPWLTALPAALAVGSVVRFPLLGWHDAAVPRLRVVAEPVAVLAVAAWVLAGSVGGPAGGGPALDLAPPLRGGTTYVVHGGGNAALNYHGALDPSQRYALDLTRLGPGGRRAVGIYPRRVDAYAGFGGTVVAPLSGLVVAAVDGVPDQRPPRTRLDRPYGNHVWVARGDTAVVLAHLARGSVAVRVGERVSVGQPVGRVGNTGSTSEPHLHLHAIAAGEPVTTVNAGRVLRSGQAVPVQVAGRSLVRNDTIRHPAVQ